ncbi:hypothetical protein NLI96_g11072 [Meripilus lineatus]|uniref:Uncharacterized protein n=1 Tax=Meripilus lineatus TaxID=2056292 RepID=A0AAD5USF1_9APHY|nr:hypothetical protein NLI96_g11072 [Physisporinus lineatus]
MILPHPINYSQAQQGINPQQLQGGLDARLQQALATHNQNMVSVLTQENLRQLDLLSATNQQDSQQSGQLDYLALRQQFLQQQYQQQHPPSQMQLSQVPQMGQAPSFGDNPQAQVPNGILQPRVNPQQQNQSQPRPLTFQELRDRAQAIQTSIKDMELQLQRARARPEPECTHEMNVLNMHLVSRKQLLGKFIADMQSMKQQGLEPVTMERVANTVHQPGPNLASGDSIRRFPPSMGPVPLFGGNTANDTHHFQATPQQQNHVPPRRPMTVREHAQVVQNTIKDIEVQLQTARAKPELESAQEVNQLNALLTSKKQLLGKLIAGMRPMKQRGLEQVTMEWVLIVIVQIEPRLMIRSHSHNPTRGPVPSASQHPTTRAS